MTRRSIIFCVTLAAGIIIPCNLLAGDIPKVRDDRLQLSLIAEDPLLRTPIGLAIDDRDRIFVLESHTHQRPRDYIGPESDRVLCFADKDDDGNYESVVVFASEIQMGMNLAFSPDGVLHVVSAKHVWALPDEDHDGVCDGNRLVLKMTAGSNYAHNCLLGIAFDRDGRLYLSRGNVGATAWEIVGSDGSRVEGYGDGGNIIRSQPDGTQVAEFASGFWNPIQMKFDRAGRLWCVDNDPDARGPNRLIDVVQGGDYGHRHMYGGSGNHPFQGWDGDLPGTLSYAGGTGEAPCDLLDTYRTSLPKDYLDSLLVTVWNENTIERHRLSPDGLSMKSESSVLVSGGHDFRPVAIDANSKGEIFFTDWVLVNYPNHSRGRLWRLSTNPKNDRIKPADGFARTAPNPIHEQRREFEQLNGSAWRTDVRASLVSNAPVQRHLAVLELANSQHQDWIVRLSQDDEPQVRLAALLACLRCTDASVQWKQSLIAELLGDSDPEVRRAALIAVGVNQWSQLRPKIDQSIRFDDVTARLFETYLACVECLAPQSVADYQSRKHSSAKDAVAKLNPSFLRAIFADEELSPHLRALALARMDTPLDKQSQSMIQQWADSKDSLLQLAAINRWMTDGVESETLLAIAQDPSRVEPIRCEAILALQRSKSAPTEQLFKLVSDPSPNVATQAARSLKVFSTDARVKSFAQKMLGRLPPSPKREALAMIAGNENPARPQSLEAWQIALSSGGEPDAGRRVFHSQSASCSECHRVSGHQSALGPNLGQIARSIERRQLVHSILRPSDQFAPQYQAWNVLTSDGEVFRGIQIDHKANGAIELILADGMKRRFEGDEIEDYKASSTSLMPDGLEKNLTVTEMKDLVAYLLSLQ